MWRTTTCILGLYWDLIDSWGEILVPLASTWDSGIIS